MTAVLEVRAVTRSERQAVERKFWIIEAAEYLIEKGVFAPHELDQARGYAGHLAYRNTDEGGELMEPPRQFVDDDLCYEAS